MAKKSPLASGIATSADVLGGLFFFKRKSTEEKVKDREIRSRRRLLKKLNALKRDSMTDEQKVLQDTLTAEWMQAESLAREKSQRFLRSVRELRDLDVVRQPRLYAELVVQRA